MLQWNEKTIILPLAFCLISDCGNERTTRAWRSRHRQREAKSYKDTNKEKTTTSKYLFIISEDHQRLLAFIKYVKMIGIQLQRLGFSWCTEKNLLLYFKSRMWNFKHNLPDLKSETALSWYEVHDKQNDGKNRVSTVLDNQLGQAIARKALDRPKNKEVRENRMMTNTLF